MAASALEDTWLCGEGLGTMHGHVIGPPGVPELTAEEAPGRRKDNPFERERALGFGSLDIIGHLITSERSLRLNTGYIETVCPLNNSRETSLIHSRRCNCLFG